MNPRKSCVEQRWRSHRKIGNRRHCSAPNGGSSSSKNASSSAPRRAEPRQASADKRNACTHTRVQPVFHVFTLGRVAAVVTCTYAHRHATGWTQNRQGGACRPHKCACVRDEFIRLCLVHVHAYVNTRRVATYARTYIYTRPCTELHRLLV